MCGPLALAAPIDQSNQHKAVWGAFKYNLGRISSYTYLGFLVGLIGLQNWLLGAIQWISIATGSIMILSIFLGSMETWLGFRNLSAYVGKAISSRFSSVKRHLQRYVLSFLVCSMASFPAEWFIRQSYFL